MYKRKRKASNAPSHTAEDLVGLWFTINDEHALTASVLTYV